MEESVKPFLLFERGEDVNVSWNIDENYKIEMTKGDTPTFGFEIFLPDGSVCEIEKGDKVVFAAKANKYDSEPAFTIEADMESKTVSFKEEHTKALEIGKYIWELSLNKENGYRCTFIANKKLNLTVEVA